MKVVLNSNERAIQLHNSSGRDTERMSFVGFESYKSVHIAIRTIDSLSNASYSSRRWAPMRVETASGEHKDILVNIRSAAKRLNLTHKQVLEACKSGTLGQTLNENKIRKIENLLPYIKLKMDEADKLVSALNNIAETKGVVDQPIMIKGASRHILYLKGKFYLLLHRQSKNDPVLARGGFKKLKTAIELESGKVLALLSSDIQNLNNLKVARAESEMLEKVQGHKGFPKTYGILEVETQKGPKHLILEEFYRMGSLKMQLKKQDYSIETKYKIAEDVSNALFHLHKNEIQHRDIKPDNILLKEENGQISAVLTDFGLATESFTIPVGPLGTKFYVAPEYFTAPRTDEKVDIWSLGLTFVSLFRKNLDPKFLNQLEQFNIKYKGLNSDKFLNYVGSIKQEFWLTEPSKNTLEHLIWSMLQVDPKRRISAYHALKKLDKLAHPEKYVVTAKPSHVSKEDGWLTYIQKLLGFGGDRNSDESTIDSRNNNRGSFYPFFIW